MNADLHGQDAKDGGIQVSEKAVPYERSATQNSADPKTLQKEALAHVIDAIPSIVGFILCTLLFGKFILDDKLA